MLSLLLLSIPNLAQATACSASDYLNLIGGSHSYVKNLYVAPNTQDDLLIAGNFIDRARGDTTQAQVYLFS